MPPESGLDVVLEFGLALPEVGVGLTLAAFEDEPQVSVPMSFL